MKLVLLPGMDGTGDLFARFTSHLPSEIEPIVIRYPNEAWDYEQLLPFVLKQLPKNEPFVLLGESFSGPLAISVASQNPLQPKALILVCTFARNPRPLAISVGLRMRIWPPTFFQKQAIRYGLTHGLQSKDLENEVLAAFQTLSPETIWARLQAIDGVNRLAEVQDITCPILYLSAKQDRLIPRSCMTELAKHAKNFEIVEVDGSHCLLQSNPTTSASAVTNFVRSNG